MEARSLFVFGGQQEQPKTSGLCVIGRLLQKNIGMGTRELTDKFVILRAKELLCNTTKYIKEIAANLEFSSDKAFIAFFKYHEGISPSKYRKKFCQIHMNNK